MKWRFPDHELPARLLRPGDLLVCEGGEIGRAAIWTGEIEPMSFQNHIHRLRPILPDVEPRFYVYFLQSAFTQLGLFEGAGNRTTIPNISRSRLAALDVPHPPLGEQRAIAAALARVREGVRAHERSTALARELKHAAMQALFTRGLRGEQLKETEIGQMPQSWDVSEFRSVRQWAPVWELRHVVPTRRPNSRCCEFQISIPVESTRRISNSAHSLQMRQNDTNLRMMISFSFARMA